MTQAELLVIETAPVPAQALIEPVSSVNWPEAVTVAFPAVLIAPEFAVIVPADVETSTSPDPPLLLIPLPVTTTGPAAETWMLL